RVVHSHAPLDGDDICGPLKWRRRKRPWLPCAPDHLEEVFEAGWGDDPDHHEILIWALVDQLVLDVIPQEARSTGDERVAHAIDHRPPGSAEADLQLDLVTVRVLAHAAARRDGLKAHSATGEPGARRVEPRIGMAIGRNGLPVRRAILRLRNDGTSSDAVGLIG